MSVTDPCPRCQGILVDDKLRDEIICINCGWRPRTAPLDVQQGVDTHNGEPSVERAKKHLLKGKPTPSWSERVRRRIQRRSGGV